MQRRKLFTAFSLLACVFLSLSAVAQTAPSGSPAIGTKEPSELKAAPEFRLHTVTGESIRLSDFRGRVVLLNFWATWCGACKLVMPWLVELQNEFGPRGLQVIGVTLDDDATQVEIGQSADEMRVNYPILIGNDRIAESYGGVPAMPEISLISRDGKVVEMIIGVRSKEELRKSVLKALNVEPANLKTTLKGGTQSQTRQ